MIRLKAFAKLLQKEGECMPTRALRLSSIAVLMAAQAGLASLAGCASSHACNISECGCGASSTDTCVQPAYVLANGLDGKVYSFPAPGGNPQSPISTPGANQSLGMTVLNYYVYISSPATTVGGAASIDGWSVDLGDGSLDVAPDSPFLLGPLSVAAGLAADPASNTIYVGDVARIDALQQNLVTGALTPVTGSPFPGGTNLFLTVDPLYRFLFSSDDGPPGNVFAYTIGSNGALTAAPGSPYPIIPGFSGTTRPFGIVVDPTGSFVYVALNATNQIAAFSINGTTGALTPVPGSPFATGNQPLNLIAADTFLYASFGGQIYGYSINASTGVLTPLANSPFSIEAGPFVTPPYPGVLFTAGASGLQAYSINSQTGALTPSSSAVPFAGATVLSYVF